MEHYKTGCFPALILSILVATPWPALAAQVRQPDTATTLTRIAFGSCSFQAVPQPIFRSVVASQPNLYISLGDAIYGDYDLETKTTYEVTPESLRREWQVLADNPDWQQLVAKVPVMATWDNHDYGHHSAGAEFPLKEQSKALFLDFFAEPEDSARRKRPGIYDAKIFGPVGRRLQVILLDTRSFKSLPMLSERPEGAGGSLGKYVPNFDPAATLLGEAQWEWLEQQLHELAELRLIVSSGQIIADQKGMDEWGNYPLERQRLLSLVGSNGSSGVLLISGNVHFSEISAIDDSPHPLIDFTSSGLTHTNTEYAAVENRYRVAGPFTGKSFGLVEIDWEGQEGWELTLKALAEDGSTGFEYRISQVERKH